jgi:cell wall-associated NlpC family hydrolase
MNSSRLRAWLHPRYPAPALVGRRPASTVDRNASAAEGEWVRSVVEAYGESFRADLLNSYHWTQFSTKVRIDRSRHAVQVTGHALLGSMVSRFVRGLRPLLDRRWNVVLAIATADANAQWRSLVAPVTAVWREWPGAVATPLLSTEILRSDGRAMVLAKTDCGTLVRAIDGTVGWVIAPLTDRIRAAETRRVNVGGREWRVLARSFVGAAYRAGGTTPDGFDCSGLAQRIYTEVSGAIIPRHSADQFAAHLGHGKRPHEGQLAFLRRRDGSLHVGVVIRSPHTQWSVIHASSSRGAVVEDALEEYAARGA